MKSCKARTLYDVLIQNQFGWFVAAHGLDLHEAKAVYGLYVQAVGNSRLHIVSINATTKGGN